MNKMNKMLQRIKRGKLQLSEWLGIKYIAWIGVNVWYWFQDASLTEVFLINGLIWIIQSATKVHSTALGMMVGWEREPIEDPHQKFSFLFPKDDKDIN